MSFTEWFAKECFSAIHGHDHRCEKKEMAFSELLERPQNQLLRSHFASLGNVLRCEMGLPYPNGKESDLFIERGTGERLYCEIKAMYKTWFRRTHRPYPAYLWSPFKDPSKEHSAGFDIAKLATFPSPDTTHVALVIIGSSLPSDRMEDDLDEFARLANIDSCPWTSFRDFFANEWHDGYCYDLRVWACEWKNVATWWTGIEEIFRPYGFCRPL